MKIRKSSGSAGKNSKPSGINSEKREKSVKSTDSAEKTQHIFHRKLFKSVLRRINYGTKLIIDAAFDSLGSMGFDLERHCNVEVRKEQPALLVHRSSCIEHSRHSSNHLPAFLPEEKEIELTGPI